MTHSIVSAVSMALVDAAARSLLAAAAVGAGLALLRVRHVVAQKAAWVLVLAGAALMPLLTAWSAQMDWLPRALRLTVPPNSWIGVSPDAAAHRAAGTNTPAPRDSATVTGLRDEGAAFSSPHAAFSAGGRFPSRAISRVSPDRYGPPTVPGPVARRSIALTRQQIAMLLYGAVCAALFLRLLLGLVAAMRLWHTAEPIAPGSLGPASERLRLRSSFGLASPVTLGSGIVLPADYAQWDAEKLRIVLAHEGSHVRQRDFYLQFAVGLYTSVFWFSPLGWWLKRKLSDLSETISDRAAVGEAASHASYAQVLLEFAALPRPLPIGVAMARNGRLIPRIERLLNESSFRQAFAGGWGRIAAAVLLVPVAVFAATARVHVQAAGQEPTPPPAQAPATPAPHAKPAPDAAATPQAPTNPPAPAEPDTEGTTLIPEGAPQQPPPPMPPDIVVLKPGRVFDLAQSARAQALLNSSVTLRAMALMKQDQAAILRRAMPGFNFAFGGDGNAYALVTGEGDKNIHFSGGWFGTSHEQIEKARKVAHGDFLWFERDGKSYVIDDPAILAEFKTMQARIDELGSKQEELGKQQEELGKQQEELGRLQEQASVPTPDMSKELARLNEAIARLNAMKGGKITQDQLAEIESRLGDLQGRIGDIEGLIGAKQGEIGAKQGKLGEQEGQIGAEQGKLGAEQGRLAREMDGKILSTIDECLKNGKARLVQ